MRQGRLRQGIYVSATETEAEITSWLVNIQETRGKWLAILRSAIP
jgi:hypothetical protein